MRLSRAADASRAKGRAEIHYRRPQKADGPAIWALIRSIQALDDNSLYCNLLQCSHFADTCALAELARSEEHTSELQSLMRHSYAVFCLKTKNTNINHTDNTYTQQQ